MPPRSLASVKRYCSPPSGSPLPFLVVGLAAWRAHHAAFLVWVAASRVHRAGLRAWHAASRAHHAGLHACSCHALLLVLVRLLVVALRVQHVVLCVQDVVLRIQHVAVGLVRGVNNGHPVVLVGDLPQRTHLQRSVGCLEGETAYGRGRWHGRSWGRNGGWLW
eukprot:355027-Chlamydomonas_euryale.AAC.5